MTECKEIIELAKQKMLEIKGNCLEDFQVHVVEPEYNIACLICNDSAFAINGALSSEVLTITRIDNKQIIFEDKQLKRFEPYSVFFNKKIIQVRSIGEE